VEKAADAAACGNKERANYQPCLPKGRTTWKQARLSSITTITLLTLTCCCISVGITERGRRGTRDRIMARIIVIMLPCGKEKAGQKSRSLGAPLWYRWGGLGSSGDREGRENKTTGGDLMAGN